MNKVFINTAFTKAINDYTLGLENIQGITYNSFLVVVIRMLISIYSELDIINPMTIGDEELLKENLAKYGFDRTSIDIFFADLECFYEEELINNNRSIKHKNKYFILIQKELIDMLISKKLNYHLTEKEVREFYDLLYTPLSNNPLRVSYNFLMANDVYEIDNYFKKEMRDNVKVIVPKEKNLLNVKAYEILGLSMDNIKDLENSDVDKLNSQVYSYFNIRENAINKEYLLDRAIDDLIKEQNRVTSGNGYVDILIVFSIVCTVIMLVGIIAFMMV